MKARKQLRGWQVLDATASQIVAACGDTVQVFDAASLDPLWRASLSILSCVFRTSELCSRALRRTPRAAVRVFPSQLLIWWNGKILILNLEDGSVEKSRLAVKGVGPLPTGVTMLAEGEVVFGEYWPNGQREPVHIWGTKDGGRTWAPRYVFPEGTVRHIHGIHPDPWTGDTWVTTGDKDPEARILRSGDGCRTLELVGSGSQLWRSVDLCFTRQAVYWGTDSPNNRNWIMRLNRATGEVDRVAEVSGPVYYGEQISNVSYFSTAVEREGGTQDRFARIYRVEDGTSCDEVFRIRKDQWSAGLFGYGTLNLIRQASRDELWVSAQGVQGGSRSVLFEVQDDT